MADLGLDGGPVEVWPGNLPAVELFIRVSTQWRVGIGGSAGLDYPVVFRLLDNLSLPQDKWDEMFEDIRVMEAAALDAMRAED